MPTTPPMNSSQSTFAPPSWAHDLSGVGRIMRTANGLELTVADGSHAALATVVLDHAAQLDAPSLETRVTEAYRLIRTQLATLRHPHPVRFWNHLPGIHQPMDERRDRYMVFNAGRFKAMNDWFDGPANLPTRLPAASGVGHDGNELVIHCLSLAQPGVAIDNPRQIPSFRYSHRYGPLPPCFARGTLVTDPRAGCPILLAAGTASIWGERSVHVGDLSRQMNETLENLRSLLINAGQPPGTREALGAFVEVRIYHLHEQDAATVEADARVAFGPRARIEVVRADLCRADLLVEIEGMARLPSSGNQP